MAYQPERSTFLEAAAAPPESRLRRLQRLLYGRPAPPPPPADTPTAQAGDDPRRFWQNTEGSGSFGRWTLDGDGLPAYVYEMDQYQDDRARYPNTENLDRRDHWHQVGNFRVTGLASNDGLVQAYLGDRGGVLLNRFEAWEYHRPARFSLKLLVARLVMSLARWLSREKPRPKPPAAAPQAFAAQGVAAQGGQVPPRGSLPPEVLTQHVEAQSADAPAPQRDPLSVPYTYAGGFSYLDDGSAVWATAFRYCPARAQTRRVFGMGYFETETTYRDIRVTRRVYAPYGDDPVLLADVRIENLRNAPAHLRHYEYWDVNIYQMQLDWLRSGLFAAISDRLRRLLNAHFTHRVSWVDSPPGLRFRQQLRTPPPAHALPPDKPSEVDWSPADVFLADLSGHPDAFYADKAAFFGKGGAFKPDAARAHLPGDPVELKAGGLMPYCLILRRDLHIEPGQSLTLRYAYGAARPGEPLTFLDAYRRGSPAQQTAETWKENLAYFYTGQDPVLHREMAWHAYNLLSATIRSDFHGVRLVPQGAAYLFLHGADGAPRDQALFTLPMTYLNPGLARDLLRLIMRLTDGRTGQVAYAFAGHGALGNGLGLHTDPSDLDLFFLLAMAEYLAATGDMAFLDEQVPFYPPDEPASVSSGTTVLDHLHVKVKHLFEAVGIGDNGLIKVRSGDWSDSIVLETALRDGLFGVSYGNSKEHGESIPNTQMALYVLPLLGAILAAHAPELAARMADPVRLASLRQAAARQWNPGGWYNRAVLRDSRNQPVMIDRLDLEAQPWALISGLAAWDGKETTLIETINAQLDEPSPIGGALLPGGMVWPAISQLLTWAYVRCSRPDLAWRSLNRNTFAMHAYVYPDIWFNIWSGPDGINGTASDLPGGTWFSPATPMTDFPVMNANQDAMALLGLLRMCGIEPAPEGDGLDIKPAVPRPRFVLDMPLLRLEVAPGRIAGEYRAAAAGSRALYIHLPPDAERVEAFTGGQPAAVSGTRRVRLALAFRPGERVPFEVRFST